MKGFAIVLMLIVSVCCQDLLTPSKHKKYEDNVQVNLKTYGAENKRIRTDLNKQIRRKKALVVEGNAYNTQLKKVTGYVNTWGKDIKKTKVDTENFEKAAKKTRVQWAGVKKTQMPPKGAVVKVKAKSGKALKKKATRRLQAVNTKRAKNASKAKQAKKAVKAKRAKNASKAKKAKKAVKAKRAKNATAVKAKRAKNASKAKLAKKAVKAKREKNAATVKAKRAKNAAKGKAAKAKPAKIAVKVKAAKAKPSKEVQGKTLESVNAQYRAQVTELEKNVIHVIKQIKIVYANAERDDKDAAKLQLKENKTLQELKTFLKHLMEYIKWTRTTMRNYHRLFHSRPDNVFAMKTRKLINKIRAVL